MDLTSVPLPPAHLYEGVNAFLKVGRAINRPESGKNESDGWQWGPDSLVCPLSFVGGGL